MVPFIDDVKHHIYPNVKRLIVINLLGFAGDQLVLFCDRESNVDQPDRVLLDLIEQDGQVSYFGREVYHRVGHFTLVARLDQTLDYCLRYSTQLAVEIQRVGGSRQSLPDQLIIDVQLEIFFLALVWNRICCFGLVKTMKNRFLYSFFPRLEQKRHINLPVEGISPTTKNEMTNRIEAKIFIL